MQRNAETSCAPKSPPGGQEIPHTHLPARLLGHSVVTMPSDVGCNAPSYNPLPAVWEKATLCRLDSEGFLINTFLHRNIPSFTEYKPQR